MINSLQKTYDGFADTYEENRGLFDITFILDDFFNVLTVQQGNLLDLGCGAGEPVAQYFIDNHWAVTGIDFSTRMLELAKQYVPQMKTVHSDMTTYDYGKNKYDAITATYSLFHIPAEAHLPLFNKLFNSLKPGGHFLFTYATIDYTGSEQFSGYKKFIDTELFYSHKKPVALFDDLSKVGFTINTKVNHTICGETFLWVSVSKP